MEVECKLRREWNKIVPEYDVSHQVLCESKWNKKLTFYGENIEESSHKHIKAIYFKKCIMKKLPKGLSKMFPYLELLSVNNCGLEEISKEDLSGFKNLKNLVIKHNELKFLPENLFDENVEVAKITFKGNKLIHVGANILNPLVKLKSADFRDNLRIDYKFKLPAKTIFKNIIDQAFNWSRYCKEKLNNQIRKTETYGFVCSGGLYNDFDKYISNEDFKDFKIIINESEFKVHKFLITARSPYFKELMKQDPDAYEISFEHIPPQIFQNILDFVYDEKLPNNEVVVETYAAASKLQIQELQEFCASRTMTLINDENALKILYMANEYKNDELKLKAFDHIKSFFPDKKLKTELASNPEAVKKLIAAKKEIEKLVDE